jgi:hypothetical protein
VKICRNIVKNQANRRDLNKKQGQVNGMNDSSLTLECSSLEQQFHAGHLTLRSLIERLSDQEQRCGK